MNTAECIQSIQNVLESWSNEGGQWLTDADRVLADSQRMIKEIEVREQQIDQRESALAGWQRSLEQRERLLVERERLLTEGLVQMSNDRAPVHEYEPVLENLLLEIEQLRNSLRQTSNEGRSQPIAAPKSQQASPKIPSSNSRRRRNRR